MFSCPRRNSRVAISVWLIGNSRILITPHLGFSYRWLANCVGRSAGAANKPDHVGSVTWAWLVRSVTWASLSLQITSIGSFTRESFILIRVWLLDISWIFLNKNRRIPKSLSRVSGSWTQVVNRITPRYFWIFAKLCSRYQYNCDVYFSLVRFLSDNILRCTFFAKLK